MRGKENNRVLRHTLRRGKKKRPEEGENGPYRCRILPDHLRERERKERKGESRPFFNTGGAGGGRRNPSKKKE